MINIPITKGFNKFEIREDYAILFIENIHREIIAESKIDIEDLELLKKLNYSWHLQWCQIGKNSPKMYYVKTTLYYYNDNGKKKSKPLYLHNLLSGLSSNSKTHVNHKNHNTLDNRKSNLEVVKCGKNIQLRDKPNCNNKSTGIRNVNYIKQHNQYWVQIMKDGVPYRWVFNEDQFEEACECAKLKRIELFGKE